MSYIIETVCWNNMKSFKLWYNYFYMPQLYVENIQKNNLFSLYQSENLKTFNTKKCVHYIKVPSCDVNEMVNNLQSLVYLYPRKVWLAFFL